MAELKVYRMNPLVPVLAYGTKEAACFDMSACLADRPSVKGFDVKNQPVIFLCLKMKMGLLQSNCPQDIVF